jgi:MoaA/NifB/PqqE/SkfB family radical SAM enzyme
MTTATASLDTEPADAPEVVAVRHHDPRHARVTLVDWMLGNRCNYACSYCPDALHDGTVSWQRLGAVTSTIDRIVDHYVDGLGRSVWIQFTGGEPTVNPDLPKILEHGKRRGCGVSLISNGSRTTRYWRSIVGSLDSAILTFHPEQADRDAFLEVARLVAEKVPTQINVAMLPDRFDETYAFAEALFAAIDHVNICLKAMLVDFGAVAYPYTERQKEVLVRAFPSKMKEEAVTPRRGVRVDFSDGRSAAISTSRLILEGLNRWEGFRCMAGVEALRVTDGGEIHRAVCGVGGRIGRIGETLMLPVVGITCDRRACHCVSDIHITKRRIGQPPGERQGSV